MQKLPHTYVASAKATLNENLTSYAEGLPDIECAPPHQFDGPGDVWSPEELLLSSISTCLILSFRAIAKMNKLEWLDIDCKAEGLLEKVDRKVQFTKVTSHVSLKIANPDDAEKAVQLVHKAEETCFISNSLNCECALETQIRA